MRVTALIHRQQTRTSPVFRLSPSRVVLRHYPVNGDFSHISVGKCVFGDGGCGGTGAKRARNGGETGARGLRPLQREQQPPNRGLTGYVTETFQLEILGKEPSTVMERSGEYGRGVHPSGDRSGFSANPYAG